MLWYHVIAMKQPKKLFSNIEYTHDAALPELDIELEEFITVLHDHLDTNDMDEELKDTGVFALGHTILLSEDEEINENQFEEPINEPVRQNLSLSSIFKKILN